MYIKITYTAKKKRTLRYETTKTELFIYKLLIQKKY